MISRLRSLLIGGIWLSTIACGGLMCFGCRDTIIIPTAPTPTPTPIPTPTPAARNTIQFRVVGNASSVRVRFSSPADGLTQLLTSLPYDTGFSTNATSLFLSLEATPLVYQGINISPFLSIQIVVNDAVFREATSADFSLTTLSVSGTWRQ